MIEHPLLNYDHGSIQDTWDWILGLQTISKTVSQSTVKSR